MISVAVTIIIEFYALHYITLFKVSRHINTVNSWVLSKVIDSINLCLVPLGNGFTVVTLRSFNGFCIYVFQF